MFNMLKFLLIVAVLLDDGLQFRCMLQFTLHQFTFNALLDLGCEAELILHTLVFVQKLLHVAALGLLQMLAGQLTRASSIGVRFGVVIQERVECSRVVSRCVSRGSFLLSLLGKHIMLDQPSNIPQCLNLVCRLL